MATGGVQGSVTNHLSYVARFDDKHVAYNDIGTKLVPCIASFKLQGATIKGIWAYRRAQDKEPTPSFDFTRLGPSSTAALNAQRAAGWMNTPWTFQGDTAFNRMGMQLYKGDNGDTGYSYTPDGKAILTIPLDFIVMVGGLIAAMASAGAFAGASGVIDATATGAIGLTSDQVVAAGYISSTVGKAEGNQLGLIGKVAGIANGDITAIAPTDTLETATDIGSTALNDDFDYASFFDPVDYSSGESFTAFSDADNVDFGFGAPDLSSAADDGYDWSTAPDQLPDEIARNATAESTVSDYGSTSQGGNQFDPDGDAALPGGTTSAGVSAAAKAAVPIAAKTLTPTGGGAKYSQTTGGAVAAVLPAAGNTTGSAPATSGIGGLITQLESAIPKSFTGQLGANKTAPGATGIGGISMPLLIGGGLLIAAIIFHKV